MPIFADAYIPLCPVAPVAQIVLLIVIIIIEGLFIRKRLPESSRTSFRFWLRIGGFNLTTAALGLLLAFPFIFLESSLLFGWGSDDHQPLKWYTACALYGLVLPWSVWLLCYHLSWRTEYWLLKMSKGVAEGEISQAKKSVRDAHRVSYALLALPVLIATIWYWISVFLPAVTMRP